MFRLIAWASGTGPISGEVGRPCRFVPDGDVPSRVQAQEVEEYVRQSPRNFGVRRTRWTLALLAEKVPCLAGLHPSAVWHVLRRLGMSYKRAAPWLHSPDPDYVKKNAISKPSSSKRGKTRKL